MSHVLEAFHNSKHRLREFLSEHKIVASVVALLTVVFVALFWGGAFDAPDPQGQIGLSWIKPVGSESAYVGSNACQSCHPAEFQTYAASPHARTVQEILPGWERPEFGSKQTVTDLSNNVLYAVRKGGGKNEIVATRESTSTVATARWAFGSGTHAHTYLAQDDATFMQLRITYYPSAKKWNFTPGNGPGGAFHEALGDPYTPAQAAACFGCHSTVLTGSRQRLDLAHSILNVGCESCHGPGRSHVESVTSGGATANTASGTPATIIKPSLHSGAEIMQLCGSCHRMPMPASNQQPFSETLLPRFPGIALVRSRCFIASAGKLSCVTCHNPHQSAHQQTLASFDRKCMSCHTSPHGTPCARKMQSNCVSCHMPEQSISRQLPLRFHNHWIRKFPQSNAQFAEDAEL